MPPLGRQVGGGDDIDHTSAKHLLDSIGKKVHGQVKNGAKEYENDLKGNLSQVSTSPETVSSTDTCTFEYDKHTISANGNTKPCGNDEKGEDVDRFSDKQGAQCDRKRINDSNNYCGACAPFRRLHLCDKNMEKMVTNNNDDKAKHDLLAEVCYAAKYEGESIKTHHPHHQLTNPGSQLCTELARSFADIGDIVRGRDLYFGNSKEKKGRDKLEDNLKKIFGNIYEELNGAQERYGSDTTNYYQLREDWWEANRETVWKALTCDAPHDAQYFRGTCGDNGTSSRAIHQCRCQKKDGKANDQVPTYFDYVPQYLRWFEEWGEDFCRKRKHKLENAIKNCRGDSGNERYCDLNKYDCTQTASGEKKFVEGEDCIDCHYSCSHFVKWIDKQKVEFDKQKRKYTSEITGGSGSGRRRRRRDARSSGSSSNYDGYENKFYEQLKKSDYSDVDAFLQKLSREGICQSKPHVGKETADAADFSGKNYVKTFSHTEYCQACPWCGAKEKRGGGWEPKAERCGKEKEYKPGNITTIDILTADKKQLDIFQKYKKFCDSVKDTANGGGGGRDGAGDGSGREGDRVAANRTAPGKNDNQIVTWQCYYDDSNEDGEKNDNCVEGTWDTFTKGKNVMPYNKFFWDWVHDMLIDSIEWRKEHGRCINKDNGNTCKNSCKRPCECFLKWVRQKEKELKQIKQHFGKQKDIAKKEFFDSGMTPDVLLELVLEKKQLLDIIQDTYGNAKETEHIKKLLNDEEEKNQVEDESDSSGENNTTIDKLLQHEEQEAKDCQSKHSEDKCKEQQERGGPGGRSLTPDGGDGHDSDEDEDDDGGTHSEPEETAEDTTQETEVVEEETVAEVTDTSVDVCKIVGEILTKDNLKDACTLKYVTGKNYGWKCIPTTSSEGEAASSHPRSKRGATSGVATTTSSGATCIPPRRRKLYIHDIQSLGVEDGKAPSQEDLLKWFVKSAAMETFFLWDKFKKEWKAQKKAEQEQNGLLFGGAGLPGMQALGVGAGVEMPGGLPEGQVQSIPLPEPGVLAVGGGPPAGIPLVPGGPQLQNSQGGLTPLSLGYTSGFIGSENEDKTPQQWLQTGHIPPDFLRLMFYTLADYRDILVGNTNIVEAAVSHSEKEKMQKIQTKIKDIVEKPNGGTPPTPPVKTSGTTPKDWWDTNAQHIWNGMICALTYKENGAKGGTALEQIDEVKNKLLDTNKNTPIETYKYDKVQLKEDDESGPMRTTQAPEKDTPLLSDFIKRPPYFRYLEEWGENFCKERKKRLEKIKEECTDGGGKYSGRYCGGDGFDCTEKPPSEDNTFKGFQCPGCGKHCGLYKKWIKKKRKEFDEQKKKKYDEECTSYDTNNYDKEFCATLKIKYPTFTNFLQKLGSCSKNNNDDDNDNVKDKLDFDKPDDTFKQAQNCDPCPAFGVQCKRDDCSIPTVKDCTDNGNTYKATDDIEKIRKSTDDVNMLVSDNNKNGFDGDLDECKEAHIFKGIRKEQWKCGKVCGYDVCTPITSYWKKDGEKQNIQIRTLFKSWIEYFFEDYNNIRKKLMPCIENGNGSTCISGCEQKCKCVKNWIDQKRREWQQIRGRFNDQYKNSEPDENFNVRSFLETLIPEIDVANAKNDVKNVIKLSVFDKSCGCSFSANSTNGNDKDAIDCMLNKLETKANKCKDDHKPSNTDCTTTLEEEPNVPLEETEENENPLEQPNICPPTPEPEPEPDDKCEEARAPKEVIPEKKVPVPPPKKPEAPPRKVPKRKTQKKREVTHHILPEMLSISAFPLSVGIAFAAFTYFVLKKKTKSSVGNLFQILQIPKGDYDTPTLKSSNRYIPYASDRYKGKTYIYMEGDSSGDEKYAFISDTTDVTSSESEYEELDINDIYVPGSPKYKTLIEVVLEPSKRDIPSDDIPSSDTPMNKFTDDEWNQLKHDFISDMLQSQPKDVPNDYKSGNVPLNTQPNTLYFDKPEEKPFITSIHDRNLYSGDEYSYNVNMVNNDDIPMSGKNDTYSGIDLINDSLNSNNVDIYDEVLKRKENELFGTNHPKHTNTHNVAKNSNSDPIDNQLDLFHTWLDRHRDMCEQWNNKEKVLDKLKEEWNKDNNSGDIPIDSNKTLNTYVSIQIDMDNPKPKNEFTNMDTSPDKSTMDTILDDLEKYNEPYYYDFYKDDIYYDVNDDKASVDHINMDHNKMDNNNSDVPTKVQIEMNVINN
ncbi:erythrocyte membrane protein 1, PfEMP1, putative [Plasmodium sp. gorilla clade G1]|nr:erythrocyte membrane protein 1, PfEMP1, putative [Plasmodium sp. gorilla clade G1]